MTKSRVRAMVSGMLAGAVMAAAATAAQAADIARPAPAPIAVPAPAFSWTGFYVGGNVGYAWGSADTSTLFGSTGTSGWLGGGQLGFNYQFSNNIVAGIEADIAGGKVSGGVPGIDSNLDLLGSVRGRLGYAAGRFLPYVTGGFAYGNTSVDALGIDQSKTLTGWTAGAGLEYALTDHWTAKTEYLYTDLGSKFYDTIGTDVGVTNQTVRAGINFKF